MFSRKSELKSELKSAVAVESVLSERFTQLPDVRSLPVSHRMARILYSITLSSRNSVAMIVSLNL